MRGNSCREISRLPDVKKRVRALIISAYDALGKDVHSTDRIEGLVRRVYLKTVLTLRALVQSSS